MDVASFLSECICFNCDFLLRERSLVVLYVLVVWVVYVCVFLVCIYACICVDPICFVSEKLMRSYFLC